MESDDSLAYVLGHEIAHAELQHHLPALKMAKAGEKMGYDMVGILGEKLGRKLGFGAASLLSSVYDQDQEFAADRLGLCLARVAGYSASGGKAAMDILNRNSARPDGATEKQKKGESVDSNARVFYDIMNTHPPAKERSEYLSTLAGALKI
jgi:Zn-dependent protease with chaperone function